MEQRQNAMCATLHMQAIDPALSGKREKTWRGEVAKAAQQNVKAYKSFSELRNRYGRQWQLQSRNSYEAGSQYSRMLSEGCRAAGLPTSKAEFDGWRTSPAEQAAPKPTQVATQTTQPNREAFNQSLVNPASYDMSQLRARAEHGETEAQHALGVMYMHGYLLPPDENEAEKWLRLASDRGNAAATYALALLHETSKGGQRDPSAANRLYQLAASRGSADAKLVLSLSKTSPDLEQSTILPRRATPSNSPPNWVTGSDYPFVSLTNRIGGVSGFKATVSKSGAVTECTIVVSSGMKELDDRACSLVFARARFYPARDQGGNPVEGTYFNSISWKITQPIPPQPIPPASPSVSAQIPATHKAEASSGDPDLAKALNRCEVIEGSDRTKSSFKLCVKTQLELLSK